MKARLAIGVILFGLLVGCSNSGPTAPESRSVNPPETTVTPAPEPTPAPTPNRPCLPARNCEE